MPIGKVCSYLDGRGYGFIAVDDMPDNLFFHISELQKAGVDFPHVGDRFEFEIDIKRDGRTRAINMQLVDDTDQ